VTLVPADVFSVPTPFVTVQVNAAPETGLSQASYAVAVKDWFVKGRTVVTGGTTPTRTKGPGVITTGPLSPCGAPKDAWMRIVSARVYVCVASVAVPPAEIARLVVPRTPLPGVTPSSRRAARATVPFQLMIVLFVASLAVTVTENGAPAAAVADAVT